MSVKFTDITVFCIIPPIHVKTRILFNYKSPLPRDSHPTKQLLFTGGSHPARLSLVVTLSAYSKSPRNSLSLTVQ